MPIVKNLLGQHLDSIPNSDTSHLLVEQVLAKIHLAIAPPETRKHTVYLGVSPRGSLIDSGHNAA